MVKRHFHEINFDTQKQDFTVMGIGDMSGDVFGNGMLLSEHIKLVVAFNHIHIFLDPDPDPNPIPEPGLRAITVVYESEQATPEFAIAARSLQLYSNNNKHLFRLIDNDAKLSSGEAPEWLTKYISLAHKANVGDPFMVVTARSSDGKATVVALVPFPTDKDKAIEILKKFGG